MESAGSSGSFLVGKGSEVASNVLADTLDLGELGGAAGGGLGVSEGSEFLLELVDRGADGLGVAFSDLLVNFLFHHSCNINEYKKLI